MGEGTRPYRRLVLVADMERYSARSTMLQHEAQEAFLDVLDAAGVAAGLDRGAWRRQSSGDGEVAVLPADVDEPALLSAFLLAADQRLRAYNGPRRPHAKVRIRIAVHQGLLFQDSRNGFAGDAVNTAARLVDSPVLKQALKAFPEAAVACIVSESIHSDVVSGGYEGIRPERFRKVRVVLADKGFEAWAWLQVVDEDVNSAEPRKLEARQESAPGAVTVGDVQNRDGQIAIGPGATSIGGRSRHRRAEP